MSLDASGTAPADYPDDIELGLVEDDDEACVGCGASVEGCWCDDDGGEA
jgi:hypothetical protein